MVGGGVGQLDRLPGGQMPFGPWSRGVFSSKVCLRCYVRLVMEMKRFLPTNLVVTLRDSKIQDLAFFLELYDFVSNLKP